MFSNEIYIFTVKLVRANRVVPDELWILVFGVDSDPISIKIYYYHLGNDGNADFQHILLKYYR